MTIASAAEASSLFSEAFELEEVGDWEGALPARRELLAFMPDEEKFIISFARNLWTLGQLDEAEHWYRKSIFIHPHSELSSLHLFHFLWDLKRTDDAFIEIKRFQSIAHSDDYMAIVREINEKSLPNE
jgi:tetratricopeptide (TPR) repeat protein